MKNVWAYLGAGIVGCALVSGSILAGAAAPRVIALTADDTMKFNATTIDAKPGEMLTVKLTSKGTMPKAAMAHNFVLLKKGTNLDTFAMDAVLARETDYIPPKEKASVLAFTKLAGPGETVEITFKAPPAGTYTYLCSFAGHYAAGMKGTLIVKN